jgi:hypothetical protein
MGIETSSMFEGPPSSPRESLKAPAKKSVACDEETAVMEIVGTMKSTIVSRNQHHSSRNAVNVSSS